MNGSLFQYLDSFLRYLSIITVFGAFISFIVGLWKYLDQRKREDRTKRYEQFHDLMGRVSAWSSDGERGLPLTQQLAAVYELQHFPEYRDASVPILAYLKTFFEKKKAEEALLKAIETTLKELRKE
jgi:hypothetical protein